jgi:hypothetical protein
MRTEVTAELEQCTRRGGFLRRFRRNEDGAYAVEFALVGLPFVMLLFGIIIVGLYFFVTFSLENAVERAGRLIRTGQAQVAGMTTDQFKAEVCSRTVSLIDCAGKVRVNVAAWNSFGAISPPSCTNSGGDLIPDPPPSAVPGDAGAVVLVTVCYEWELAGQLPFLKVGKMGNGSALIQASTTFRTEPYN